LGDVIALHAVARLLCIGEPSRAADALQMAEVSRLAANFLRIAKSKGCVCRKYSNEMTAWVIGIGLALPAGKEL
jgi:hypothetical protein